MEPHRLWYHVEDVGDDDQVEDAGKRLDAYIWTLENDQADHINWSLKFGSMYQNKDMLAGSFDGYQTMPRQILNMTQPIVDSLVAKQVVNESKATFDVDDGDWEAYTRAQMLERFVFGEFYRCNVYRLHEQAFRDAAWCGDGWVKYYQRDKKVFVERTFPLEVRLDPNACVSAEPRELYQIRYITRPVACALYPHVAEKIALLPGCEPPYSYPGNVGGDLVRLVEGWHLPDEDHASSDAHPGSEGRYIFACNHIVLEAKEWTRPRFPFVRMPYSQDIAGGYSQGVVEQLADLQRELNKLKCRKLQGLNLYSCPRVYMQAGTTITPDFSNDMGTVYKWTGAKPEVSMSPGVSPEVVQEEANIINQMYQKAGISPLERGSDMPSRVDSRPGMREYVAVSDEKHAIPSSVWNRSFLDAARCIIDVAREIVAEHGSYSAFGHAKDFISKIDFGESANLEDDRFRIKLQNTNLLPTQPTGKRLAVLDLLKTGQFAPMDVLAMMAGDHPDVDSMLNRKTAGKKLVDKQMYMITVEKQYFGPETQQDCAYAKAVAQDTCMEVLLRSNGSAGSTGRTSGDGSVKGLENVDDIVNMLDRYMQQCQDILDAAAPPPAPPGAPNGGPSPQPPAPNPGQPVAAPPGVPGQ